MQRRHGSAPTAAHRRTLVEGRVGVLDEGGELQEDVFSGVVGLFVAAAELWVPATVRGSTED